MEPVTEQMKKGLMIDIIVELRLLEERFDKVEENVQDLAKSSNQMKAEIKQVSSKTSRVDATVEELENSRLPQMVDNVDKIAGNVEDLAKASSCVETKINQVSSETSRVDARVEELEENRLPKIDKEIGKIKENVEDLTKASSATYNPHAAKIKGKLMSSRIKILGA